MKYLVKLLTSLIKNKTELTLKFVKECMALVEKLKFDETLKKRVTELLLLIYRQFKDKTAPPKVSTPSDAKQ